MPEGAKGTRTWVGRDESCTLHWGGCYGGADGRSSEEGGEGSGDDGLGEHFESLIEAGSLKFAKMICLKAELEVLIALL